MVHACLALLALSMAPGALRAQAEPEVVPGANGGAEVVFGNDCVVRYDAQGRRTSALSGCATDQYTQADIAYAAYRSEQDGDGPGAGDAAGGQAPPRIVAGPDRETEVDLGDGCIVRYEAGGGRTKYESACTSDQLTRSDTAYAAYRQEQGWDGPVEGAVAAGRIPPQILAGTDRAEVVFGDNCIVSYDAAGRRTRNLSACTGEQIEEADGAMAAYRMEQEKKEEEAADPTIEPAAAPALPEVVISNGFGRVAFPGGCTVTYNDLGRRTDITRPCSAEEVQQADAAMAAYRSEQGP